MKNRQILFTDIFHSLGSPQIKFIKLVDFIMGSILATFIQQRPLIELKIDSIKRLLIIRPGGIGDAIFLLPILRNLRTRYPHLKMDILCERRNMQVFESQSDLCHAIYCYDQFSSFSKVWSQQYDVIIDTEQWHYLSALTAYFISSRLTVGFATRDKRAKMFQIPVSYETDHYELDNFLRLFEIFKIQNSDHQILNSWAIDPRTQQWAQDAVPKNSLALFLGASIPLRRLTTEQTLEIITKLSDQYQAILLLGGNDIIAEGEKICKQSPTQTKIINYIGKTNLTQTAALIKNCQLFIGPDSGILHLASAVGTPVWAIFGPGNLKKWGPKGEHDRILSLHVSCSPCTHFGYTIPTCKGKYVCINPKLINN